MRKSIYTFLSLLFTLYSIQTCLAQELYIIGKGNSRLYKADKNTANSKTDLLTSLPSPHGIAIDPDNGDIYYTDNSNTPTSGRVIRVNRDGTNPTTVATSLNMPSGIALDHVNNVVYFIALGGNSFPGIYSVSSSGGSANLVLEGDVSGGPVDVDIDITGNKLYWTDSRGPTIRRASTSGTGEEVFITGIGGTLSGISVDKSNRLVYWLNASSTRIDYASASASAPTSPSTAVTDSLIANGGLSVDGSQSPTQFFITTGTSNQVLKANFGGSASVLLSLADGIANPTDIEFFNVSLPTPTPTTVPTPLSPILNPETQITEAPEVDVTGKKAAITLRNFTSAVNQNAAKLFSFESEVQKLAASDKLVVRYDVRVTAAKKQDNQKILSKRNMLTVKGLKTGNYSVNYSAVAFQKKSKSQIDKAKSNGKTGFTDTHKKVFSTNFSPSAAFTIQ